MGPGQSGKNYLKKKEISRARWAQIDIMGGDGSWPFHPQKLFLLLVVLGSFQVILPQVVLIYDKLLKLKKF